MISSIADIRALTLLLGCRADRACGSWSLVRELEDLAGIDQVGVVELV